MCDLRLDATHVGFDLPEEVTLEKWVAGERVMLEPGTRLASVAAEDEDIPEGFRYCTLEPMFTPMPPKNP